MSGGDREFDRETRWHRLVRPALVVGAYLAMLSGVVVGFKPRGTHVVPTPLGGVVLLDWVTLCALAVLAVVGVPPLVRGRDRLRPTLRAFARDRLAAVGLAGLVALVVLATFGPVVLPRPEPRPAVTHNPPVGFGVANYVPSGCAGEVVADRCRGSWRHPLGTDGSGLDVFRRTVYGLRTSLQVGVATATVAGGVGAAVGLVAGTVGGRVDGLLMRYVDLQSALPAFFAYLLTISALGHDLVVIVLVFGLFSWGGLARLVRSEVLRVREELYVRSARAAGADPLYRLRHHVLPNVTTGVVVPVTTLVPLYVLYEAALSFLDLGDPEPVPLSLGPAIAEGLETPYVPHWWDAWWIALVPALALTLLSLCLLVVGDRTGELLDPRER